MRKKTTLSGYGIIAIIESNFGKLVSSGTIYSALYSLERKGLIRGASEDRRTVYFLIDSGKAVVYDMTNTRKEILSFIVRFLFA